MDTNPFQPTDRQMYFGDRLGLTVPAIVKLNKAHGRASVLAAMESIHGFPPPEPIENAYAYLDAAAKAVA